MKFTKDNIAIVDGEIDLILEKLDNSGNTYFITIATTNTSIPGVPHIDRKHFQKPDVDVIKESQQYGINAGDRYGSMFHPVAAEAYYDGMQEVLSYEKEFTREEMDIAIRNAWVYGSGQMHDDEQTKKDIYDLLRPLSVPQSLECNEDFTNIKVNW